MKKFLKYIAALLLCALASGCELLCQAGSWTCGLTREQAEKLLHPKAYGEYWVKPNMTRASWQQDWVACGGMSNGQYAGDAPGGSTTEVLLASEEKERKKIVACMKAKGYEYNDTER